MSTTAPRPLALVTGASTGIGFELAKVFAENGFDLIVAAENEQLDHAGAQLRSTRAHVETVRVMPGPTDTNFFDRADMLDTEIGAGEKDSAADVAHDGFDAMMNGDERVVSRSAKTKAEGLASRVLPDSVKAKLHGRQAEPGSAD